MKNNAHDIIKILDNQKISVIQREDMRADVTAIMQNARGESLFWDALFLGVMYGKRIERERRAKK